MPRPGRILVDPPRGHASRGQDIPHALIVVPPMPAGPAADWVPVVVRLDVHQLARVQGTSWELGDPVIEAVIERPDGQLERVPSQFDSDHDLQLTAPPAGGLAVLLPADQVAQGLRVRVYYTGITGMGSVLREWPAGLQHGPRSVQSERYGVRHDGGVGGLPDAIRIRGEGDDDDLSLDWTSGGQGFQFADMLHRIDGEDYALNGDDEADLTTVPGALKAPGSPPRYCVTIRAEAAYQSHGDRPYAGPSAVYTFRYFAGSHVVHVSAQIRQDYPCPWEYVRFLWLKVFDPDRELFQYGLRSEGPLQEGKGPSTPATRLDLVEETTAVPRASWVALCADRPEAPLALGFLGLGWGQLYVAPQDDPERERRRVRGEYEDYYLSGPQMDWSSTGRRLDGALWLGPIHHGAATLERAALQTRAAVAAYLTTPEIEAALDEARATAVSAPAGAQRGRTLWVLHHLERQVHVHGELAGGYDGIVSVADAIAGGQGPEAAVDWFGEVTEGTRFVDNGEIGIGLEIRPGEGGGVGLLGLYDLSAERS